MSIVKSAGRVVNKFLGRRGFQIKRVSKSNGLLEDMIARNSQLKFVQVGANDGLSFDGLYFIVARHRLRGLVIEPLKDAFDALCGHYCKHPAVRPVNIALHPSEESATIYRVKPDALAELPEWAFGLATFRKGLIESHGIPAKAVMTESVPCAHLMTVLVEHDMLDAAYLQIDTEGFDLEVLKMIDFARFKPDLIRFESKHLGTDGRDAANRLLSVQGYRTINDGEDTIAVLDQIAVGRT